MGRLQGKVAIVTGGARGMGAATCRVFVDEGAKVMIADVLDEDGAKLAASLGDHAHFRHLDVREEAQWLALIEDTESRFGPIDVLVNNAGVLLFSTIRDTAKSDFERVTGINLTGTFLGVRTVGSRMCDRGRGSIVNISSADGMKGANG
ncbi:MAG: SDR family NAD(P)-dependent oxidoreductase, partial [Panacagrimonas sp.]